MENKTKYNDIPYLLTQTKNDIAFLNTNKITVKKITLGEKLKETGSRILNKIKKFFNVILKPFSAIIKSVKKPFLERKAKKEKIKSQQELDNFFVKNYGATSGHIKEIIEKLEKKYSDEDEDFETLRQKNVKAINSIRSKSPTLVDPDAILEHNSDDNSYKPELKDLVKKEFSVANEILTATPATKKLKAKTKILVKTQG